MEGKTLGGVYHGSQEHTELLNKAYALFSHINTLHTSAYHSTAQLEKEIVRMTCSMLGGDYPNSEVCGCLTSGGTESILLAMKAYRDQGKARGIKQPEM